MYTNKHAPACRNKCRPVLFLDNAVSFNAVSFTFPDIVKNKLIKKSPSEAGGDFFDMNVEK